MMKEIEVLCPEYRGAPQPGFDPLKINESRIPDNMRFKEYDYSDEGGHLELMWKTQEPYTVEDIVKFLDEIRRAFVANRASGLLVIKLCDRDGECKPSTYCQGFRG